MREVQAADAKARLSQILSDVERGETVVITRHGRPIARIVPETEQRQERVRRAFAELDRLRAKLTDLTLDDMLSARHEGHRF